MPAGLVQLSLQYLLPEYLHSSSTAVQVRVNKKGQNKPQALGMSNLPPGVVSFSVFVWRCSVDLYGRYDSLSTFPSAWCCVVNILRSNHAV